MTQTLPDIGSTYRPAEVERAVRDAWDAADVFAPDGRGSRALASLTPFVVIQPPPNVTGALHVGHALTAAVEDAMVRRARMIGHPTLWLPGLDHASIAAQVPDVHGRRVATKAAAAVEPDAIDWYHVWGTVAADSGEPVARGIDQPLLNRWPIEEPVGGSHSCWEDLAAQQWAASRWPSVSAMADSDALGSQVCTHALDEAL